MARDDAKPFNFRKELIEKEEPSAITVTGDNEASKQNVAGFLASQTSR